MSKSLFNVFSGFQGIKKLKEKVIKDEPLIYISPLTGAVKSFFVNELFEKKKQIVLLLPDIQAVAELNVELSIIGLQNFLISIEELRPEIMQEKLNEITNKEKFILLSTYSILNCRLPVKEAIQQKTVTIESGGNLSFDDIIEYLNYLHYTKDKFVEVPGNYSQRGAIIDFWSYSEKYPVRLEFDGDFLESIRSMNPENQRSIEVIPSVTLAAQIKEEDIISKSTDIFSYLKNPIFFASSYEFNNLSSEAINCFKPEAVEEINDKPPVIDEDKFEDDFPEIDKEEFAVKENSNNNYEQLFNKENVQWLVEEELSSGKRFELGFTDAPSINSNYEALSNVLINYTQDNFKIIVSAENEIQSERLIELLSEYNDQLASLLDEKKIEIQTLPVKKGFINREEKFLLLSDYEIFNKPYRTKISAGKKYKKGKSKTFASIKRGDYVVHEDYGIGKYAGLETIKIGEVNQESMKILFNEGGVVFVNLNYLNLVKKYSSNENLVPSLSTLGTAEWQNTKQKAKKKIKEAARELITLYAKRKASKGFAFGGDTIWQKELEASFFYEDTPDQVKVTDEVKEDMEAENPMDRLVCGDVGFGKTEIAVRAAFKAVQDGKQTAILVPTTILAEQHFNTFKDRLNQFPVKVEVLSRFQSKKKQKEIVNDLKTGVADIVIGTHRLLSKDIEFNDLGLLIIDEEHRFGVKAKEKLRSVKLNVDTLTLTATPIPRTLNFSLLGARDLSIIATPPPNRQPIYTTVSTFDINKIKEWILKELQRNGQVYFIHDRIQSIDKLSGYLQRFLPDVKIAVAHGQMKPAELEDVIHKFLNKEYSVLLSTKIIESGIDIPNVNTIIVNRADRFGLAELHQLRGRVGRSNRQAYAFFIVPSLSGINKKALRRLQAIEEFTEIGAGFNISMRDLEIRGAGNLLGTEQTGFINDVGFDLFVKLINEAVEELKYKEFKDLFDKLPKRRDRTEPSVDTYFEIGIPKNFMPEQMDRLNFYTQLYSVKSEKEIEEIKEEMKDRFGQLPIIVERLISSALIKYLSSFALFERVIIQRKNIFIILPKGEKEEYYKYHFVELMKFIVERYNDKIKFSQQKEVLKLVITNNFETPERTLEFLIRFAGEIINLFGVKINNEETFESLHHS
jgi:transcription-repair coupling factor (superfamily II helicase)